MKTITRAGHDGKHRVSLCLALPAFLLFTSALLSQDLQQKPTRQSATEAFLKGDYESACRGFTELLSIYPKDPLYKYYSGVCMIKLNMDPERAMILLSQSRQGAAVVRTIPPDAVFWLGRAQQLSGRFSEAIDSYRTYEKQAGKKAARELGVDDFIQQCNAGKGQAEVSKPAPGTQMVRSDDVGGLNVAANDSVKTKMTAGKQILPDDYDRILTEALAYQSKADSLYSIADERGKNLDKLNYRERTEIRTQISDLENLAMSFQKKADRKYAEAQEKMNEESFVAERVTREGKTPPADTSAPLSLQDSSVLLMANLPEKKDTVIVSVKPSGDIKPGQTEVIKTVKDSVGIPSSGLVLPADRKKPAGVLSIFEIISKPVYRPGEKIEINPEIPPGLIYRIQVAVFRNPVSPSYFKGITPVSGFMAAGTDRTNYYAGMFRRHADAGKALARVRQTGFKDAFIVSFSGGRPVSSERAAFLEKEWGNKPFYQELKTSGEAPADTIPPTLSFRVEVLRSVKPVKPEVVESMKKIAGTRGLDTETSTDGSTVFLIGKFITYESAAEYADLLLRNGFRETKVAAWLGRKEIPVETARQLFEEVK